MAKPSRSKQPAFDPRELEDLIFTPAVGIGVGSHLLRPIPDEPRPAILPTTVDRCPATTVVISPSGIEPISLESQAALPLSTGDISNLTTVDKLPPKRAGVPSAPTTLPRSSLWITESGDVVPESRVRRIRLAQDVLNSAEESVYDTLWNVKSASKGDADAYRITQAGYDYLMKRTRLSKKTIQRIIDRLLHKDFIAIERPADIYHRTSTTYRVFSYRVVLDRHAAKGRFHAVKIGPGFLFASKLESNLNMTTVDTSILSTDVDLTTETVVKDNLTTVVPQTTIRVEQDTRDTSSSDLYTLKRLLEPAIGVIDDDAATKLIEDCRSRAGDCTMEEIAFFVSQKLRTVHSIQNPVGFMLTAIPRHFEGSGHLPVRELLRRQAEHRAQERREAYAFWSKIAEAPDSSPEDRAEALAILKDLKPPPDQASIDSGRDP